MPAASPVLRAAVSRYGGECKGKPPTHPAVQAAARDLRAARLEEYIRDLVDAAPPLTAEQRSRLAVLLLKEAS